MKFVKWGDSADLRGDRALVILAGGAAAATVVSIAAFEILMAATLLLLIILRRPLRLPPVWLPLALFLLGTVLSLALSGHAREGLPQIKKFYLYLMLLLVTTAFQRVSQLRGVALAWAAGASMSSLWAIRQFATKYRAAVQAHQDFYPSYVGQRITGFMDHWMTLSGQLMIVVLVIGALLLFGKDRTWTGGLIVAACAIGSAFMLAWTRSMWLGALCGALYLIWFWKKWALAAVPVIFGVFLLANPLQLRERVASALFPHNDLEDSNAHRAELRRIGWEMIKANPWFGVGPEQVSKQYQDYIPAHMRSHAGQYYGHLENNYLQYAAERGIPAALCLFWMIGWMLFDFARAVRRLPADAEERWPLHGAIAVILSILVSGFYSWSLNDSEVLGLFLAVMGAGYVAMWQAQAKKTPPITVAEASLPLR